MRRRNDLRLLAIGRCQAKDKVDNKDVKDEETTTTSDSWPLGDVKLKESKDKADNKDVKEEELTTTSDSWPLEESAQGQGRQESYVSNIRKYQTKVEKEIDFKDFSSGFPFH